MTEMLNIQLTLLSLWILLTDECQAKGYCSFPRFVWDPMPDGSNRKWFWRTEYFRTADTWESQNEVTAMETEIIVQEKVHTPCNRDNSHVDYSLPCYRHDTVYHLICVTEEPGGKFRIQQQHSRGTSFTCLQFHKVSPDVLIIYRAGTKDLNEDRLCYDDSLQRDPWPWIASFRTEWSFCPLHGGFDFTGLFGQSNQNTCPGEWRLSRLESECVTGEGATFFFPNKQCNFFDSNRHEQSFQCWASWKEDEHNFILFGPREREPRYILRLPGGANAYDELTAYLYTSPVATLNDTGVPPSDTDVIYIEMQMLRSEPGNCYDESPLCKEYAHQGKCRNSDLHNYGNYCKRSCGLCDFAPSAKAECNFPTNLVGDWLLFDNDGREEIAIDKDAVSFSTLGTYICKSKHWEKDFFKTISVFTNGCRPRYSCMYLSRGLGQLMNFKISRSSPVDKSFELCHFEDDPLPLGGKIRSWKEKVWLPMTSMFHGSCGIGGLVRAVVDVSTRDQCSGRVWDVNLGTCDAKSTLTVSLPKCHVYEEFLCEAFSRFSDGQSLLVLKHKGEQDTSYYCWRLSERAGTKGKYPGVGLERIHCDTMEPFVFVGDKHWFLSIQLYRDLVDVSCGGFPLEASDDAASHAGITHRPAQSYTVNTDFIEKQTLPGVPHIAKPASEHSDNEYYDVNSATNSHSKHTGDYNGNGSPDSAHAHIPSSVSSTGVPHASHKTRDANNRPAYGHVYTSSSEMCKPHVLIIISLSIFQIVYWYRI